MPGASTTANPQPEPTYDPTTFPPLLQALNPIGMTVSLRGISSRATTPPYPFPTYTPGNIATNATDALAPHYVLQDSMMSALIPMVILHYGHGLLTSAPTGKGEQCDYHSHEPYPGRVESVSLPSNFRMPQCIMFNGMENLT